MLILPSTLLTFLATVFIESDAFNSRVKRHDRVDFQGNTRPSTIRFDFFGQEYIVDLEPNHAAYHPNFKVYSTNGHEIVKREEYFGTVREPRIGKGVLTRLDDNVYIGILYFENDTLHLEPSYHHGIEQEVGPVVGYFGSDVDTNLDLSFLPSANRVSFAPFHKILKKKREVSLDVNIERRADIPNEKLNRCSLKLVADYSFFSRFGKNNTGIVTKYLVNMVARVNEIYTGVNWDFGKEHEIKGRGRFENMGFSIKEIKILDRPNASDTHYNSDSRVWQSEKLLKNFASNEGSNEFCLVHLVTARTFHEMTTLGLAYVSARKWDESAGGICSRKETFNGQPIVMNVLLSTVYANAELRPYPLITKEIDIVVAHEYGHTWGSLHDPTLESNDTDVEKCSPGYSNGGKYIMHQHAQNGYDPNNVLFSPCSRNEIREVLKNKWSTCFEEEMTSFCGNGIVEDGEECDNGVEPGEIELACCDKFCRLNVGAKCSPLNHICCTDSCQFHNSSHVCLTGDAMLCKADAVCDGYSGECPPAPPVEDGHDCIEDGECLNGVCLPFCQKRSVGKNSCICEEPDLSCRRCCREADGTCLPVPGFVFLRDGVKCTKGTCRDKICVNEVVDNVRNYFLAPFTDRRLFLESLKSNMVPIIIIVMSAVFAIIFYVMKYRERTPKKLKPMDVNENIRRVHVGVEDNSQNQSHFSYF